MLKRNQNAAKRSSLFFSVGLCMAAAIAVGMDGVSGFAAQTQDRIFKDMGKTDPTIAPRAALDARDMAAARRAWLYIANNTIPETGLVNSVHEIRSTTLWDQGSYVFGLMAAERLGLIQSKEFDTRASKFLQSLALLPLFEETLPNKVYRTDSLQMTDYQNVLVPEGLGWSALDVARLLLALAALERNHPHFGTDIRQALSQWNLSALGHQGELIGTRRSAGITQSLQEGRIGYEQYGARAAALWGLDVSQALSANRIVKWRTIEGVEVATDQRTPERFGAINPVLGEPYFLQAIELGFDSEGGNLAAQIYLAQRARYQRQGVLTAVTEDHIDQPPYFLYSSVFSNGEDWAVVSEAGQHYPNLRTLSSKAAFAWDALYDTGYTDALRSKIESIPNSGKGWPAGIYEQDGQINEAYTLNTNAIILAALYYKAHGSFWSLP